MTNVISLDAYRPNPWRPDDNCECAACHVKRMGHDLDTRLNAPTDLISLEVVDAIRHYLTQLADLCGINCQYEPRQEVQ